MKKTQFFATEVMIVFTLFLIIFGISLIMWWNKVEELNTNMLRFDLQLGASNLAELLLTSSGNSMNWSVNSVNQIGASDNYYILNYEKFDNFLYLCETDYHGVKELLNIPEYDYFVELSTLSGDVVKSFTNYTIFTQGVVWRENVIMNNTKFVLKIGVVH